MGAEIDIARRRPVWLALSELWLDTALSDADLRRIAAVLHASGYSLAELRTIYLREVAPVVYLNTFTAAGVWAGFDADWLCEEAGRRAAARARVWDSPWNLRQRLRTYATTHHWRRLEALLA